MMFVSLSKKYLSTSSPYTHTSAAHLSHPTVPNPHHRLNRAAQHELERDEIDKDRAISLETNCHGLRNSSRGISFHNGVERIDKT